MRPPRAKPRPVRLEKHGDVRIDEYAWLRQREDPDVLAYLRAENRYTQERMRSTRALQRRLYREMRSRIRETDTDVPVRVDDYLYFTRTRRGKQYPYFCRRPAAGGRDQIVLDHNEVAAGQSYCVVGPEEVSPDHRLLAYGVDPRGDERFTLCFREIDGGRVFEERIVDVGDVAWANDSRTIFYTVLDETHRPYRVYRHRLGERLEEATLAYEEPDPAFFVSVGRSRSRRFIFLHIGAKTTDEVRFVDADRPRGRFRIVRRRERGVEYEVDHRGDFFYIVHNRKAKNFCVARAPVSRPDRWRTVIAPRRDVTVGGVDAFAHHLVVEERREGITQIRVRGYDASGDHIIRFPEKVHTVDLGPNPELDTVTLRVEYTSLITPASTYDYDMRRRRLTLRKRKPVLGDYDPGKYRSERVFARAPDGTRVPISLVYRRDRRGKGGNPMLLTGYGSYGMSRDPVFASTRISLLDRGMVFAIAHVRGGGEMGRSWYEDGKFLRKKNTFSDFVACAEHLIRAHRTRPEMLAIQGGSAGGLLMGAVCNLRPDLFRVVVADVPFVDVLNTMLDPTLPLTVLEYDEWGNPEDPRYYRYIKSYAPYENVSAQPYPTMLVTAGLNDPRVSYWEPAKWVCRLRDRRTDDNELLLKTELESGHFGSSGRYELLRELAFEYAFVLTRTGVEKAA